MTQHAIVQCVCMATISIAAIVALSLSGLRFDGDGVNEPSFFVLWGVSAVYFVGDSYSLLNGGWEKPMPMVLAHHTVSLLALGFMFLFAEFRRFMLVIALQEISTFFLFFKNIEILKPWRFQLEIAFLACWVVLRVALSPLLVAWAVAYMLPTATVQAGVHVTLQTFFLVCNVYWSYEIIQTLKRRLSRTEPTETLPMAAIL